VEQFESSLMMKLKEPFVHFSLIATANDSMEMTSEKHLADDFCTDDSNSTRYSSNQWPMIGFGFVSEQLNSLVISLCSQFRIVRDGAEILSKLDISAVIRECVIEDSALTGDIRLLRTCPRAGKGEIYR
jgi:hypothetical protein